MANLFYRNPRLTVLVVLLVLVAGFTALQGLPRQEDPALSRRFATVTTFYPGAAAERVESLVTDPLERRILELHEVHEIESVSRNGVSALKLQLGEQYYEKDVDQIWSKVRDKVADARAAMPEGVGRTEFRDLTTTAATLVIGLVWRGEGPAQMDLLTRLAADLENRFRSFPGTKEVETFGAADEEVRVTVDPAVLAAAGLAAGDIARAIGAADSKAPAGLVRRGGSELLIQVRGELDSLSRVREVPLRGRNGRLLRVGDIAAVEKTVREPPRSVAVLSGERGVAVAVTMEPRQRVDLWTERARAAVAEFAAHVPRGVAVETIFDQSVYTEERLRLLAGNLLLAAAIVVCVLIFMMGLRSALVVASALPLALGAALAGMMMTGFPLHQTSITGLIIALGLLIDNAIVVVDEYSGLLDEGRLPADAVAEVVRRLFVPLLASTVTTILAFLPIILMPGPAGEFVGSISAGVGMAIGSSFLLSITVVVSLAGYFIAARPLDRPRRWWRDGFSSPRLTAGFGRLLDFLMRRPWSGVAVSLVLPLAGFAAGITLTEQFFPANDRNQFQVQIRMPAQASLAATLATAAAVREHVERHDAVIDSHWFAGGNSPRVFYNMMTAEDGVASYAGGFVTTRSARATEELLPLLQTELIEAFPAAEVAALPFEQGPPFDAPIEIRLFGPDTSVLRQLGDQLRRTLAESRSVTYTRAHLAGGTPVLALVADEAEAELAGVKLREVADRLQGNLEGEIGGTLIEGSEELPVRVRVDDGERASLRRIDATRMLSEAASRSAGPGVAGIPLAAVGTFELEPQDPILARFNGQRVNRVQAFLMPYTLIADSLADFRRRLAASDFTLPVGYRLEFGGETELRSEAMNNLFLFAFPLFVVMAGTIILSFDSFRMAAIIFCVAGLSVGLALLGVWAFGYPMGFVAIVGTMGLVGIAINDAIVVLNALRSDADARAGDAVATREVVLGASRHVIATTLTTIGGFLPLIYFGGRFWPPLATAIAGGVFGASVLALVFVPSLFHWMARRGSNAKHAVDSALYDWKSGNRGHQQHGLPGGSPR